VIISAEAPVWRSGSDLRALEQPGRRCISLMSRAELHTHASTIYLEIPQELIYE
jgi:hypothetical protein